MHYPCPIQSDRRTERFRCGNVSEVLSGAQKARVRQDFRSGARNGVNGTPTFSINGERYDGMAAREELLAALTAEPI